MAMTTDDKKAGLLVPLWTLSHRDDYGIGDLRSLRLFLPWAQKAGLSFIQLLPVNEMDQTNSPYSAISSVALDPIYLDLSAIPAWSTALPKPLPAPSKREPVDYAKVRAEKSALLRQGYQAFCKLPSAEQEAFQTFRQEQAEWLPSYSAFRYLMALHGERPQWEEWGSDYRDPQRALQTLLESIQQPGSTAASEIQYYEWLQWHCFTQWQSVSQYADSLGVQLMGDIPVGVSFDSADVFLEPDNFDLSWSGGAPPETMFKDDAFAQKWGQNWGVPLYNDAYLEETGFAWWRRRVRKHTEIFSMFRIDHVLGLYRMYAFPWRPRHNAVFLPLSEDEATEATGGRLPGFRPHPDHTMAQVQENKARGARFIQHIQEAAAGAEIIAEDLGVVPPYVRPHLESCAIAGFRIAPWEVDKAGEPLPVASYPYQSFCTFSTHDHPPMRTVWSECREQLEDEDTPTRVAAQELMPVLAAHAQLTLPAAPLSTDDVPVFSREIKWSTIETLLCSSSRYVAFMITDLLGIAERFNTPSTVGPHNWTYRLPVTVEEMVERNATRQLQKELNYRIGLHRPR